ncbi:MAG: DUF928 domain-containing protein [Cyanobacteria bacterium P01_F01_bin.13]
MKCIYMSTLALLGLSVQLNSPSQAWMEDIVAPRPPTWISERPSNLGHPQDGTRRGGGSRGGICDLPEDRPPLTALMPDTATWTDSGEQEFVLSFTNSASPELWFYLPYSLEESSRVEFALKDTAGDTLSRAQLDTTGAVPTVPSTIRVSLAELELSLIPETGYHWYLTVYCEGGPPIAVDGWINYQSVPSLEPTDKRFFVDHLSALANAQFVNPDDVAAQSDWIELLESVGLGDITEALPVDCCSFVEKIQQ